MSSKVYQLSPPRRQAPASGLLGQDQGPPLQAREQNGIVSANTNLQAQRKRPHESPFSADQQSQFDSGPNTKRMRESDSTGDHFKPQIPDSATNQTSHQEHKTASLHSSSVGTSSTSRSKPLRKLTKVKKCAGKRRRVYQSRSKSANDESIMFECSKEIAEKLEKLFKELDQTSTSEEQNEEHAEAKKPKKKRFMRCPASRKFLCEVCSKPDCNKCNNCL